MRVVYKYPIQLNSQNTFELPHNSVPLHFDCIDGELFVWIEQSPSTNDKTHNVSYEFFVLGTGQPIVKNSIYVGTVIQTKRIVRAAGLLLPKTFVWHLYYE